MNVHVPAPDLEWLGVTYRTILSSTDSGGAMSIIDSTSPSQSGPPRHIHDREDEVFVIISGHHVISRKAVGWAFIPRGHEHAFRVVSAEPSRHLVILTPSGFEGFFAEMAAGQFRIPEDMERINQSATRHHLRFTGPPL